MNVKQARVFTSITENHYQLYWDGEMRTSIFCVDTAFSIAHEILSQGRVGYVEVRSWPNDIVVGRFRDSDPTKNLAPWVDSRKAYGRGYFELTEYDVGRIEKLLNEVGVPLHVLEETSSGEIRFVPKKTWERLGWIVTILQVKEGLYGED